MIATKLRSLGLLTFAMATVSSVGMAQTANAFSITRDNLRATSTSGVGFTSLFQDISTQTRATRVLAGTNDAAVTANLGFNFNLFGQTYSNVGISSNGLLTFGGTDTQATNTDLNDNATGPSLPAIAVLWDDWKFDPANSTSAVYYRALGNANNRRFVVQWNQAVSNVAGASSVTFQAILRGNGRVDLLYKDATTANPTTVDGKNATIGLRAGATANPRRRLQWAYNSSFSSYAIGNNTGIRVEQLQ
jgi:hypothetical protein